MRSDLFFKKIINRNKKLTAIASALILLVLVAVLTPALVSLTEKSPIRMEITAAYDPTSQTVRVSHEIYYQNISPVPMESLFFHAYANAYQSEETAPFFTRDLTLAYPNGFSSGGLTMRSLRVNQRDTAYDMDSFVLKIPLENPLSRGETARVSAVYELTVPECADRFGYSENAVNLCNAFLIPAVYDQTGWNILDEYSPVGDPFYSETMDYKVSLTVPEDYTVACTGTVKSQKKRDGMNTLRIEAAAVRDFAAVLSNRYVTAQTKADHVTVVSHAFSMEDAERALEYATKAVGCFNERFGKSYYDKIEICATGFFTGGMEYPGLALIDAPVYAQSEDDFLEFCIVHEVAHQWFYGAIGNDQVFEPWVDESLAEYAALVCAEDWEGTAGFQAAYESFVKPYFVYRNITNIPINGSIYDYQNNVEYSAAVYAKGAAMWHALRKSIGDEAFFSALSAYYQEFAGKNATGEDLLSFFSEEDAAYLREWLEGKQPK